MYWCHWVLGAVRGCHWDERSAQLCFRNQEHLGPVRSVGVWVPLEQPWEEGLLKPVYEEKFDGEMGRGRRSDEVKGPGLAEDNFGTIPSGVLEAA